MLTRWCNMRSDRIRDMRSRGMRMRDGRNPYGSKGGYVVSDKRGRLLRAFPCYYILFVDEGRQIS